MHFLADGLSDAEASNQWRQLMAPLFHIESSRFTGTLPRGNLSLFMLGEIMVSRNTFNAQRLWRDQALIETSPDHVIMQYYRSGGFRGVVAGRPVCIVRGEVAVGDLSQESDADVSTSNTVGLSVPRSLLEGIDPMAFRLQLDAPRNKLLGSYMTVLPQRLKRMNANDIPAVVDSIIALLHRVFAADALDEPGARASSDNNPLNNALTMIEASLGVADLSPAYLADRVGVSRATLYRLFAPMGGIMTYVHERRLLAVQDALEDPLDKRTLAELSTAYGFTSQAIISRSFRAAHGTTPRHWRQKKINHDIEYRERSTDPVHFLWDQLGRPRR